MVREDIRQLPKIKQKEAKEYSPTNPAFTQLIMLLMVLALLVACNPVIGIENREETVLMSCGSYGVRERVEQVAESITYPTGLDFDGHYSVDFSNSSGILFEPLASSKTEATTNDSELRTNVSFIVGYDNLVVDYEKHEVFYEAPGYSSDLQENTLHSLRDNSQSAFEQTPEDRLQLGELGNFNNKKYNLSEVPFSLLEPFLQNYIYFFEDKDGNNSMCSYSHASQDLPEDVTLYDFITQPDLIGLKRVERGDSIWFDSYRNQQDNGVVVLILPSGELRPFRANISDTALYLNFDKEVGAVVLVDRNDEVVPDGYESVDLSFQVATDN